MTQIFAQDSLTSLVSGMGSDRDKSASVSYVASKADDMQLVNAYSYAWLPRAIVDMPASDCFRKWREWQGDADVVGKIEREEKRLGLREKLEMAYVWARLFGRGYVYFDTGDRPDKPLNIDRVKLGGIRFAQAYSHMELTEGDIDTDPMSPYYRLPAWYEVSSATRGLLRIHPSRIVTLWGDVDPMGILWGQRGQSVLQAAMAAIKRHDGTVANVAGLVYEARVDVITVPGLGDLLANPEQATAILERFRLMATMKGNNGLVLLSGTTNKDMPSETWEQKNTSFATLPDIIEKAQEEVSAAAKIPRSRLFGTSAGGMGSTGDLELSNYYDYIGSLRKNDIEPRMSILDECLIRSALGDRPEDLWYDWASLWQISDKERAEIADKLTTSGERLIRMGMSADVVFEPLVNALVEAGTFPGMETALAEFADGVDSLEPEMDETALPEAGAEDTEENSNASE